MTICLVSNLSFGNPWFWKESSTNTTDTCYRTDWNRFMTDLPATACAEAPIDKFLLGIGILKFFTTGGQVFGIASACLG
jgi:hypothetical protein